MRMRVSVMVVALAAFLIWMPAAADCPYVILESTVQPEVSVGENGHRVLRWRGLSFMYGPVSLWDLEVQVMLDRAEFVATYSVKNESRWARQKARVYFYVDSTPALQANAFVSAGLLADTADPGELGSMSSKCRLYERTNFPSPSFRDFTSRHNLKPGLIENANVRGGLRVRGSLDGLGNAASGPMRLKLLIAVKEARDR